MTKRHERWVKQLGRTVGLLAVLSLLGACDDWNGVYTLYRNSVMDENMRVHVATFDANDGEKNNQGNCWIARDLFANQGGVKVRYWCERGRFRP